MHLHSNTLLRYDGVGAVWVRIVEALVEWDAVEDTVWSEIRVLAEGAGKVVRGEPVVAASALGHGLTSCSLQKSPGAA